MTIWEDGRSLLYVQAPDWKETEGRLRDLPSRRVTLRYTPNISAPPEPNCRREVDRDHVCDKIAVPGHGIHTSAIFFSGVNNAVVDGRITTLVTKEFREKCLKKRNNHVARTIAALYYAALSPSLSYSLSSSFCIVKNFFLHSKEFLYYNITILSQHDHFLSLYIEHEWKWDIIECELKLKYI